MEPLCSRMWSSFGPCLIVTVLMSIRRKTSSFPRGDPREKPFLGWTRLTSAKQHCRACGSSMWRSRQDWVDNTLLNSPPPTGPSSLRSGPEVHQALSPWELQLCRVPEYHKAQCLNCGLRVEH